MKVFKQLCAIAVLTIVLAQTTVADEGVIHPGINPPPPPPPPTTTGVIHPGMASPSNDLDDEDKADELMREITLLLVRNLLALF
jgi:hypothetical protein